MRVVPIVLWLLGCGSRTPLASGTARTSACPPIARVTCSELVVRVPPVRIAEGSGSAGLLSRGDGLDLFSAPRDRPKQLSVRHVRFAGGRFVVDAPVQRNELWGCGIAGTSDRLGALCLDGFLRVYDGAYAPIATTMIPVPDGGRPPISGWGPVASGNTFYGGLWATTEVPGKNIVAFMTFDGRGIPSSVSSPFSDFSGFLQPPLQAMTTCGLVRGAVAEFGSATGPAPVQVLLQFENAGFATKTFQGAPFGNTQPNTRIVAWPFRSPAVAAAWPEVDRSRVFSHRIEIFDEAGSQRTLARFAGAESESVVNLIPMRWGLVALHYRSDGIDAHVLGPEGPRTLLTLPWSTSASVAALGEDLVFTWFDDSGLNASVVGCAHAD